MGQNTRREEKQLDTQCTPLCLVFPPGALPGGHTHRSCGIPCGAQMRDCSLFQAQISVLVMHVERDSQPLFLLFLFSYSVHAVRIPLPRKSLEKLSEGKGDLCRSSAKQNLKHLDRDFYTSYQSSVLSSRKPFAIDKGFFSTVEHYYSDKKTWLDVGAGTCETMREIEKKGHRIFGIELSDVCITLTD